MCVCIHVCVHRCVYMTVCVHRCVYMCVSIDVYQRSQSMQRWGWLKCFDSTIGKGERTSKLRLKSTN